VVGPRLAIAFPELLEETRRTFDIREEEGDGATRQLRRNRVVIGRWSIGFGSRPRSLPMVDQKVSRAPAHIRVGDRQRTGDHLVDTLVRFLGPHPAGPSTQDYGASRFRSGARVEQGASQQHSVDEIGSCGA
jgi:hypothetical protein